MILTVMIIAVDIILFIIATLICNSEPVSFSPPSDPPDTFLTILPPPTETRVPDPPPDPLPQGFFLLGPLPRPPQDSPGPPRTPPDLPTPPHKYFIPFLTRITRFWVRLPSVGVWNLVVLEATANLMRSLLQYGGQSLY